MSETAYIGLGSNQAEPLQQLQTALKQLEQLSGIELDQCSPFYLTAPIGPQDQPDYINAVARVQTPLPALDLLELLQLVETSQGRKREQERRWGERTLDLDLLVYGDVVIDHPRLQVPHPRLPERAFVLYPLADIAPALEIPGMGRLADLIQQCPAQDIKKLEHV